MVDAVGFQYSAQYSDLMRDCKTIRKRLGLSIPQLSKLTGDKRGANRISATMLYYFEDGQRILSEENCRKVHAALIRALDAGIAEDEKEAKEQKEKLADRRAMRRKLDAVSAWATQ